MDTKRGWILAEPALAPCDALRVQIHLAARPRAAAAVGNPKVESDVVEIRVSAEPDRDD